MLESLNLSTAYGRNHFVTWIINFPYDIAVF